MRALLCGVRGSTAAPGTAFAGVGGHTSCVAIPVDGGRWIVLDAGTGLRRLARRARRTTAARLDPVQPPPLGPHPGPAVPAQPRRCRRRRRPVGARRQRRRRSARRALAGDVAAALPDHARPVARHLDVPRDGAGAAAHRGHRRAHARDRPQGRPHVRPPARGRGRKPRLRARPLPVDRLPRDARLGAGADRRCRRAPPRRSATSARSGTRPSSSATPSSTTLSTSPRCVRAPPRARAPRPGRTDEEIAAIEQHLAGSPVPVVIGREGMWVGDPSECGAERR